MLTDLKRPAPCIIKFATKVTERTKNLLNSIGSTFWNISQNECAGLFNPKEVNDLKASIENEQNCEVFEPKVPLAILTFPQQPTNESARTRLEELNFKWWKQNEVFGLLSPNVENTKKILEQVNAIVPQISGAKNKQKTFFNFLAEHLNEELRKFDIEFNQYENFQVPHWKEHVFIITAKISVKFKDLPKNQQKDKKKENDKVETVKSMINNKDSTNTTIMNANQPSIYSNVYNNPAEKELFNSCQWLPEGMSFNFSVDLDENKKLRIGQIDIKVTDWDDDSKAEIEMRMKKIDSLKISTSTPETVLPWILQFPNLELLEVEVPEMEDDEEEEEGSETIDSTVVNATKPEEDICLSEFNNALRLEFNGSYYSRNQNVRTYVRKIYEKFKDKKRLGQFTIIENCSDIILQVARDYKKNNNRK